MAYEFRGQKIPDHMMEPLRMWIEEGRRPGHFLQQVLMNNLSGAVGRADDENLCCLGAYVGYLYNEAPGLCWGSEDTVDAWEETFRRKRAERTAAERGKD